MDCEGLTEEEGKDGMLAGNAQMWLNQFLHGERTGSLSNLGKQPKPWRGSYREPSRRPSPC